MKRVLLFILMAQSACGMLQKKDNVTLIIRKSPLLLYNSGYKNSPLLFTVVNASKVPLFLSPASFSRPLFTFTQAYAGFNQVAGIRVFNALVSYSVCFGGAIGSIFGGLTLFDRATSVKKTLYAVGGALAGSTCLVLGILALLDANNNITISNLQSYYLYLPTIIPPSTSLDKLIWLQDDKPNDLKISLLLPDKTSLDFNFTADQLMALT